MPAQTRALLQDTLNRIAAHEGFDVRPLVFEAPATIDEVAALEEDLDIVLPLSFREVLLNVSRHVEFRWHAPENFDFPAPFRSNFCGDLHWSCDFVRSFDLARRDWVEKVFPDPLDPYDAVWHDKLAFYEVGNGDYLAIDMAPDTCGRIVYLSHDDGEGHGHVLALDFQDLLRRWIPLGCTGGEDWQWWPFTDNGTTLLDPDCTNARQWRELLGLTPPG